MRPGSMLTACLLALFGGCQACSDCTDYAPPASFTAPGEVYAGEMLPAGPPVVPQVLPPEARGVQPMPLAPEVDEADEADIPMARRH